MRMMRSRAVPRLTVCLLATMALTGCAALQIKQGGFNLISIDEEWAMRDDFRRQVAEQYTLVGDRQALAYLDGLGQRIVATTALANREWTFGLVDDPSVNAFNLPGGLVYVTTGLVDAADSLDEFAAVVGHEIAHGVARHGTQLMTRSAGFGALAGAVLGDDPGRGDELIASLVAGGVLSDYSRDAEREADRLGMRFAYDAGYDPEGAVRMYRTLLELRGARPGAIDRFFASHPLSEERVAAARALADRLPDRAGLISNTAAYTEFRRRVTR